ncbi:leucyl aminopeptidase family protein [Sulfitobacter sp. F26204]|uniref:leucyl aminopeptidase family protein n=1 Tax=Sulfitobacter sp. F26204 TaxID=2996014 RepID=UPI00225E5CCC|nr:leucyl aminopeptidase family protein [Sulfitobacter sp. F26204]MCX7558050.1 leucyl aminopeptidase family protein [Sulfitobacter sp. F26204]
MSLTFAPASDTAIPLHVLPEDQVESWLAQQPAATKNQLTGQGFTGALGQAASIAGPDGTPASAVVGFGTEDTRRRGRFHLAAAVGKLPKGDYRIISQVDTATLSVESLGWLLAAYRFDRYRKQPPLAARLVAPDGVDITRIEAHAAGEALTRDLINTPANDMGPPDLEQAARDLVDRHGAAISVIAGDELLTRNFPLIHTVGRAADRAPRLIDMTWGTKGPKLTLVGKGVCFDTGGLNLKPGASMALMKKDMGGAAAVLGLAHMIMATGHAIQLRVLIPAVENAVSGNAFRPGDILTSRKGLTVEINNTDAEGRLVLADALALADEENPDQIISMATLTGAARVAVGPDLAPYYSADPAFVAALENAAQRESDPVWRLPFHDPYETLIEPGIADIDNAPKGGFAGSITAALFLRRFVTQTPYAHFDIYGWQPGDAPARPKGGVGQATRALHTAISELMIP